MTTDPIDIAGLRRLIDRQLKRPGVRMNAPGDGIAGITCAQAIAILDEVERLRGAVEDVRRSLVRLSDDLGSEYDVSDIDGLIARLTRPSADPGSASSSH